MLLSETVAPVDMNCGTAKGDRTVNRREASRMQEEEIMMLDCQVQNPHRTEARTLTFYVSVMQAMLVVSLKYLR